MKISCQSCQAKYAIADEKVIGKVVRIRCKKCSVIIIVDGKLGAAAALEANTLWMVHLAPVEGSESDEGQQVELPASELVVAYAEGRIDDATFCWKDGMADWLPLGEIAEIAGLIAAVRGSNRELSEAEVRAAAASNEGLERASLLPASTFDAHPSRVPPAALPSPFADAPPAALFQNPGEMNRQPSRPSYPERSPSSRPSFPSSGSVRFGVDGAAVEVQGNDDPRTGSPSRPPSQSYPNTLLTQSSAQSSGDMLGRLSGPPSERSPFALALAGNRDIKMTGERDESSVLFSLAAVKGEAPPPEPSEPGPGENSGMIDMRALMNAQVQNAAPPGGRVDDIMNLSPGGLLAGSLAPPMLSSASVPPAQTPLASGTEGAKSNGLVMAGVGFFVLCVLSAAAVGIYAFTRTAPVAPTVTTTVTTSAPPASTAAPSATASAPAAPPFNLEQARTELTKIAKAAALSCKKRGGATGTGKVLLTFSNDGKVASAKIDGSPFEKTPVGDCVVQRFSEATVPAFGGGTQPAAKTFVIQ